MHANDILKYGHSFFMNSLEGVDAAHLLDSGVCGVWSVKDIVAHIGATELMLIDVLNWIKDNNAPIPMLQKYGEMRASWNDFEVNERKAKSYQEVLDEYLATQAKTAELIETVPLELQRKIGALSWYGEVYDLEDYIVYSFYGHKREHGAEINHFKDKFK
jgi:hypothetical protein